MIANGYDEIAILRLRAIEMSAHFGMPQDFEFKILHIFWSNASFELLCLEL